MTLPSASYHAKAVTFGCMAKGKGVSSRANLLISVKVLVGNAVTTGHHARAVSPDYLVSKKKKRKEEATKNEITKKNKRHEWAWKELHP
jgi:tetrahydromethanopterin S-methyltransferase subunit H